MFKAKDAKKDYDVIIVGGGPAGLFAAGEIAQDTSLRVLLIEKGRERGSGGVDTTDRHVWAGFCKSGKEKLFLRFLAFLLKPFHPQTAR